MTSATVHETEVLVVGAGPSGCATALSLLNYSGLQEGAVFVVEQSDLGRVRVGEQVSPTLFKFLDYLKLSNEEFIRETCRPSFNGVSYWGSTSANTRESVFTADDTTYQLDREEFDLALIKKVSDLGGVVLPRTRVKSVIRTDDQRWSVELHHPEQGIFHVLADYLVDATGRNASIARQLGIELEKKDNLVGVGCFLSAPEEPGEPFGHVLESCEFGWWYCAHLPNNQMVVSLFADAGLVSSEHLGKIQPWLSYLADTSHLKRYVSGAKVCSEKPWVRNAGSQRLLGHWPDNFIAVGEAACAFDPISSMGIGFAISSGCQAAIAIMAQQKVPTTGAIELYRSDLERIFSEYLETCRTIYSKEKRWEDSEFWLNRAS
ncbi:lysine-epsilon-oxidase maturase LodB [Marinomonas ostreistagni]|uniref:Lysine-epsilon-oxidase maturase LodB n=1 Tax=Marinomonas ostreistagni TaxID=359209 RepID=A0ABS0Z5Z3_9GAMM|nr:lysine-epsilon-oxidase maturase LodB [Marinomonas ostreistagni]MBJ7549080.1 lysine-epsilon-oxidase maturase LodB [Marinomonas ostreistagni]